MKSFRILSLVFLAVLAGCSSGPSRTPGASLGSGMGLVAMQISILGERPSTVLVHINSNKLLIGREIMFEINSPGELVVRDVMNDSYHWSELWTTITRPERFGIKGILPDFKVQYGCINYLGEFEFDFRKGQKIISRSTAAREQTLALVKQKYPMEFEKYGVCK